MHTWTRILTCCLFVLVVSAGEATTLPDLSDQVARLTLSVQNDSGEIDPLLVRRLSDLMKPLPRDLAVTDKAILAEFVRIYNALDIVMSRFKANHQVAEVSRAETAKNLAELHKLVCEFLVRSNPHGIYEPLAYPCFNNKDFRFLTDTANVHYEREDLKQNDPRVLAMREMVQSVIQVEDDMEFIAALSISDATAALTAPHDTVRRFVAEKRAMLRMVANGLGRPQQIVEYFIVKGKKRPDGCLHRDFILVDLGNNAVVINENLLKFNVGPKTLCYGRWFSSTGRKFTTKFDETLAKARELKTIKEIQSILPPARKEVAILIRNFIKSCSKMETEEGRTQAARLMVPTQTVEMLTSYMNMLGYAKKTYALMAAADTGYVVDMPSLCMSALSEKSPGKNHRRVLVFIPSPDSGNRMEWLEVERSADDKFALVDCSLWEKEKR